jgi:hypothetical protein
MEEVLRMSRARLVLAAFLLIIGVVWIGQGTDMLAGSAMSGQPIWALVGVVLLVAGLAIGVREFARRPAS